MSYRRAALAGATALTIAAGIIIGWEGKSNQTYLDLVQVPTICHGTTRYPNGTLVRIGDMKSDKECYELLMLEVNRIDAILTRTVKVKLKDHERAALISWIYNVGEGAFYKSTLLRKLNAGDVIGACNELPRWVYAGGKKVRGLENRRSDELALCLGVKNGN